MRSQQLALPVFLGFVLLVLMASAAQAVDPVYTSRGNVAVGSYDTVAYFMDNAAVRGEKSITHEWNGAVWRFATTENRDKFAAEPERYAPQYGGYCAYAVSKGSTASGDPEAWTIHEGKLYLNYNKSIRTKWRKDIPGFVAAANGHWPKLLAK